MSILPLCVLQENPNILLLTRGFQWQLSVCQTATIADSVELSGSSMWSCKISHTKNVSMYMNICINVENILSVKARSHGAILSECDCIFFHAI